MLKHRNQLAGALALAASAVLVSAGAEPLARRHRDAMPLHWRCALAAPYQPE